MTIAQTERFYAQDNKKYEVAKNKELLIWLKNRTKKGYHTFIDIEDLQETIDTIVSWYEIKYPKREMEFYEGTKYYDFEDIKSLSKYMSFQQLMFRLPYKQLRLMECNYRSNAAKIRNIYNEKGEIVGHKSVLYISIKNKNDDENKFDETSDFLLYADCDNGKVDINSHIRDIVETDDITLDELLILFKNKYINNLDLAELEQCVYEHNCDIELRNMILQLAALKLLYSKNTIPERGYERAKRFINEFNKKLNLNLTTEEIDEAISRDYNNGEKWEEVLKTYIDKDGNERSYWTVEDTAKKEEKETNKVRRLVKSMFNK